MIPISLTTALALYSAVLGVLALGIWLYTEATVRRSYRALGKQFLWRCVFCGYVYLDEGAEQLSQCPRCESFNSVSDAKARFVSSRAAPPETGQGETAEEPQRNTSHRKRPHQRHRGPRRR